MSNKRLITYVAVTVFCGLFAMIYEHFSHGIYSYFMVYLFTIPLVLGVIPEIMIRIFPRLRVDSAWARLLDDFAIATLAVGSTLQGVFDIYGTTDNRVMIYLVAGVALLILSMIVQLTAWKSHRKTV